MKKWKSLKNRKNTKREHKNTKQIEKSFFKRYNYKDIVEQKIEHVSQL